MIKLAVAGARGRMGQAISRLAFSDTEFQMTALLEHPNHPESSGTINNVPISTDTAILNKCDALIDFTLPEGTLNHLEVCLKYHVPIVIGTTGMTPEQIHHIHEVAKKIPVVFSTNMSVGVNILFKLIELVGNKIGSCEISISETHHIHKKDAPSGTAKTMAEIAEKSSGQPVKDIKSFREGEVIGDHDIIFETPEDILTVKHHAKNRDMFAKGALLAAKFLQNKKSGLYHMQDVLGMSQIKILD